MEKQKASELLQKVFYANSQIEKKVKKFAPWDQGQTDKETLVQIGKLILPKADELWFTSSAVYNSKPGVGYSGGFFAAFSSPWPEEVKYTLWTEMPFVGWANSSFPILGFMKSSEDTKIVSAEETKDGLVWHLAEEILGTKIEKEQIMQKEFEFKDIHTKYLATEKIKLK